jgi:hypothetical protein
MAEDLSAPGYGKIQFGSRQHGLVGSVIARPNEFDGAEANARLIAAAPDMLSALYELVQFGPSSFAWEHARDAIAKAEGPL